MNNINPYTYINLTKRQRQYFRSFVVLWFETEEKDNSLRELKTYFKLPLLKRKKETQT